MEQEELAAISRTAEFADWLSSSAGLWFIELWRGLMARTAPHTQRVYGRSEEWL